jgi:CHASE3 domain sensor protein
MDVAGAIGLTGGILVIPVVVLLIISLVTYFKAEDSREKLTAAAARRTSRFSLRIAAILGSGIILIWIIALWMGMAAAAVV